MISEEQVEQVRAMMWSRAPGERTELIEAGRVRDYLAVLGRDATPREGDPVPEMFLVTLGRTRRPELPRGGSVNLENEFEFHRRLRVGDEITLRVVDIELEPAVGRKGPKLLSTTITEYRDASGELVARSIQRGAQFL